MQCGVCAKSIDRQNKTLSTANDDTSTIRILDTENLEGNKNYILVQTSDYGSNSL